MPLFPHTLLRVIIHEINSETLIVLVPNLTSLQVTHPCTETQQKHIHICRSCCKLYSRRKPDKQNKAKRNNSISIVSSSCEMGSIWCMEGNERIQPTPGHQFHFIDSSALPWTNLHYTKCKQLLVTVLTITHDMASNQEISYIRYLDQQRVVVYS